MKEKLLNYLDLNQEEAERYEEDGTLTENTGRDEQNYFWYYDGSREAAINISSGEIITDQNILSNLFE